MCLHAVSLVFVCNIAESIIYQSIDVITRLNFTIILSQVTFAPLLGVLRDWEDIGKFCCAMVSGSFLAFRLDI